MATTFVLPTYVADGTLSSSKVPAFTADGTFSAGARFPTSVADGTFITANTHFPAYVVPASRTAFFLPTFTAGNIYFVHTPVGGVIVGGAANIVGDPWIPTGGVKVGGAAVVSSQQAFQPTGGVKVGGTATVVFRVTAGSIAGTISAATADLEAAILPNGKIIATGHAATSVIVGGLGGVATIIAKAPMARAVLNTIDTRILVTAPMAVCVLTGYGGAAGVIIAKAPRASGVLTAYTTGIATIIAQSRRATGVLTAVTGLNGSITAKGPRANAKLTSYVTITGTITATAPMAVPEFSGGSGIVATLSFSAPMAKASLTNEDVINTFVRSVVLNSVTNAVTEYENYNFDSFTIIGGTPYAAGADGLYELDSSGTDALANINAHFETGAISFGSEYLKRMETIYAAFRTTGDIRVSVRTDEGTQYAYNMKYDQYPTIRQRRVPVGKGLKGKYWQFKFENVDGSGFGFDTFNILVHETVRRVGV